MPWKVQEQENRGWSPFSEPKETKGNTVAAEGRGFHKQNRAKGRTRSQSWEAEYIISEIKHEDKERKSPRDREKENAHILHVFTHAHTHT